MAGRREGAAAAAAAAAAPPPPLRPRRPVHPFPARMTPDLVLGAMKGRRGRMRVVDPMAGSGTVLAVARDCGHDAAGTDTDPLAVLMARVWTAPVDKGALAGRASAVLEDARGRCRELAAADAYPRGADEETKRFVRYWFDPVARRQLASLAAAIRPARGGAVRDALWCAFSRLIIAKQAGASLAMDLAHSRPHKRFERAPALPLARFESAVGRVAAGCIGADGESAAGAAEAAADVRLGDARRMDMRDGSADMVITSPPYLNAIDYMRCSKFSLVWMGHTVGRLRGIRAGAIGTEVGMYDGSGNGGSGGTVAEEEKIISALGLGRRALRGRARAILARYVRDMGLVVEETARVLDRGGTAVYVVGENTVRGAFIRNSRMVEMLAADAGLEVASRHARSLPRRSRYLPPPPPPARAGARRVGAGGLGGRMRREVVLEMRRRG